MRRLLQHKRKFLPLFIGLLLIGLLIGLTIPLTGLAVPAENKITDFFIKNPQESVGADKISLRFAFSTDSKNYAEYGVVYSNTSDLPVVGKDGCTKNEAWKVHSSANSNLEGHDAGSGRYWVETKIGNIWHTQQDEVYYVRAYVKVGDTYYYGDDVIVTTPNQSVNHKHHTVPSPSSTTSAVSLVEPGTRVGTCSVCGRSNKTEYVNPAITTEHLTSSSSGTLVKKAKIYSSMLHGARHFYPDEATNDGKGNDLLIEFSFLWNPSLANLQSPYMEIGRIANNGGGDGVTPFYLNFADNASGQWVPFAGGFEGGAYNNVVYGPAGVYQQNPARKDCAFIGENGWHRIGVRIHEDAWINGNVPNYRMTATLYVDGQALSQLSKTYTSYNVNLLYTASVVDGELQYVDIPDSRTVYGFRLGNKKTNSGTTADFIYAEYSVTCNREFQQDVEPVPHPIERLPSNYSAPVFYRAKTHESMPVGDFNLPVKDADTGRKVQPTEGQHPRLLFTADQLDDIRNTLNANSGRKQAILTEANKGTTFTLTDKGESTNSGHRLQKNEDITDVLCVIRNKAFMYQIDGDEDYGIEAINMMFALLDAIDDIDEGDKCRTFGEGMFVAALVYDWCYDLLGSNDRDDLILKVQDKLCKPFTPVPESDRPDWVPKQYRMEIGFPPSGKDLGEGAICDHGCERQLLRDYLAFSIAIFDQDRSWYDYVAGRLFEEYVPVRDCFYESGYYPQGISNYLQIRFGSDLWSAWLMKASTGDIPYSDADNMKQVLRTAYSHVTNGTTRIFGEGDMGKSGTSVIKGLCLYGMISGYLFDDSTAMAWADYMNYDSVSAMYYVILKSSGVVGNKTHRNDDLSLILYTGGFLGQTIAHKSWGNDASVFMKIGEYTTAGHDHQDSGSFQIYYKGRLSMDSGCYDNWNSDHHQNYTRRTIAHNSIVLYRGSTILQQDNDHVGGTTNFETWQSDYRRGTVTGHAEGYVNGDLSQPKYAYLAGDVAQAYEPSAYITRLDRRMLAVYDTDEEHSHAPMFFFVYDYIVAQNNNDVKTFLLHVHEQPHVSQDKHSAYVDDEDGRLVWQCVLCGNNDQYQIDDSNGGKVVELDDEVSPYHTELANNRNFLVNGVQIHATKTVKDENGVSHTKYLTDDNWGRLELKPDMSVKNKHQQMLNVFFVCDKDSNMTASDLPATHFSNTKVQGAAIGNTVAVFVTQEDPIDESVGFYTTGVPSGTKNYYVSNLAAGNWVVHYGNNTLPDPITVTEEGHFMTFSAPTGTIVLEYLGAN